MFGPTDGLIQKSIPIFGFVFLALLGCDQQPENQRFEISGETMGTYYRISLIDVANINLEIIENKVSDVLENVNAQMSTYLSDSQISKFNTQISNDWYAVSPELVAVSQKAHEVYQQTQGVFDPTIGPLVNLWSFGPNQRPLRVPKHQELEETRGFVGADKLKIQDQPPALKKMHSTLNLDLSAIAKGHAVDKIAGELISLGQAHFLIDIGGELRAEGKNLSAQSWRVGIEKPQSQVTQSVQQVVSISGKSIATSGSYRNYFEQDNKRYSHIINPLTGYPIEHKLVSVSVISEDCMTADAYATALMVLGPEYGYDFALQYGLAVYMIEKNGDEFVSRFTPQMKPFME